MDCVIPQHSVRMFCAAIGACSKIGKDLYVDFDAIEGLSLRALNEAKSAYVCYKFHPTFFERCTAPPLGILESVSRKRGRSKQSTVADSEDDDDEGTTTNDENRLTCRLAIKALAAAVRQRKNVQSLRLYAEQVSSSLHLSFEYLLSPSAFDDDDGTTCWRVVHRVPVADFPVNVVSAVASRAGASEMTVTPRTLCRLLEPLSRQAETAWVIPSPQYENQMIATCFQHQAAAGSAGLSSNKNALWTSHLQTEMRLSYDDLDEMEFVDNRDEDDEELDLPDHVNESIVLVFSHREAKAILSWAASSAGLDIACPVVRLLFHWGGRPLVLEQQTEEWKVELVLATLDHKLLGNTNDTSSHA